MNYATADSSAGRLLQIPIRRPKRQTSKAVGLRLCTLSLKERPNAAFQREARISHGIVRVLERRGRYGPGTHAEFSPRQVPVLRLGRTDAEDQATGTGCGRDPVVNQYGPCRTGTLTPPPLNFTKDNYYGPILRLILDRAPSKKKTAARGPSQTRSQPGFDGRADH